MEVLYQSVNFIVVNKGYDIIINTDDIKRVSLEHQLKEHFPHLVNKNLHYGFYFPHRLDFATSGVMCIALNKISCAAASTAFRERTTKKYYLALLRGHMSCNRMDVNLPIGEADAEGLKVMSVNGQNSRPALSRMLVLERGLYRSFPATKVLMRPLTGRRHQLRVHCHSIGHTIVGDYTYSDKNDSDPPRMYLHSYRLIMPNNLELIDVRTEDPFVPKVIPEWQPTETVYSLNEATIEILQQET